MEKYSEKISREMYRVAYLSLVNKRTIDRPRDLDLSIDEIDRVGCYSSGCTPPGETVVWRNLCESDFGDWNPDETSEGEFVDYCMECFGGFDIPGKQ